MANTYARLMEFLKSTYPDSDPKVEAIEFLCREIDRLDALSNKHPLPVNGICECECNSTIREIYDNKKLTCTQCGGNVIARPTQNSENIAVKNWKLHEEITKDCAATLDWENAEHFPDKPSKT